MKNKIILHFLTFFLMVNLTTFLDSKELDILSKKVSVDNNKIVIFENDVVATDEKNNIIYTDKAKYDKYQKTLDTIGYTKIITSEGYKIIGKNILFDDDKKIISSSMDAEIIDKDGNKVFVTMFNYMIDRNIFISKGKIKLLDIKNNEYYLSEIYMDEKKNKIIASDVRAFLNDKNSKYNEKNEPRFFANSMLVTKGKKEFNKGIFTYCKNREGDKCPPWVLKSKKINHDPSNKTIYYKNAILKVYDFPIFYFPFFSHPDPSVKRRSGFLVPTFRGSSNTGSGLATPYFWDISDDKDITFTPRLYTSHHPLLLGEFRQNFESANLIVDTGYTAGFKKETTKKKKGSRYHFFTNFIKSFSDEENVVSELQLDLQHVNRDTHFKLTDINSTLVSKNVNFLDSTLSYAFEKDDLYFGSNVSMYNDLSDPTNSKYEYLLPYLTLEKNIVSNKIFGTVDWNSNVQVRNYDVNKQTEFFVNDAHWTSNSWINNLGIENKFQGLLKAVNYNSKKTKKFKNDKSNSELSGAIGYLAKLGLYKNNLSSKTSSSLTPKIFLRYVPGHMRTVDNNAPLKTADLYRIKRFNEIDFISNGLSASVGFDYKTNQLKKDGYLGDENLSISIGQVISKERNFDIPRSSSLDQKLSDLVGNTSYKVNKNLKLKYNFSLDHNYEDVNYNEIESELTYGPAKFNIGYLEENKHIGNQEYVTSNFEVSMSDSGKFSVASKRNLLTNSFEYYNFSYDYINDCLKAGLVYRREFYKDRDLEPNSSIMFRISIVPFADIKTPNLKQ